MVYKNTKTSHETALNSICWYLQGTKRKCLMVNLSKSRVVDFYVFFFTAIRRHENSQDLIYSNNRTGFVVTFSNFTIL